MNEYKFNPLNYGYEPVSLFPELSYIYPLIDSKYFIRIEAYSILKEFDNQLVYWYSSVNLFGHDDRIEIHKDTYDWRRSLTYHLQRQFTHRQIYLGLITSDQFAKALFSHFRGLNNSDIRPYTLIDLGIKMRLQFPNHYKSKG